MKRRRLLVITGGALVGTGCVRSAGPFDESRTHSSTESESALTTTEDCVSTSEKMPDLILRNESGAETEVEVVIQKRSKESDDVTDVYHETFHLSLGEEHSVQDIFGYGISGEEAEANRYSLRVRANGEEANAHITGLATSPLLYVAIIEIGPANVGTSTSTASGIKIKFQHGEPTTDFRPCATPTDE